MFLVSLLSIITCSSAEMQSARPEGEAYAVLVAGSNHWSNYRHQADVCHAYHILRNHGIPEQNIIVMMYDDVAYHYRNPNPGKLFNKPSGDDVYEGVKIDYKGDDVTPANFINILKGNASAVVGGNGRVLKTKRNDRIFIFFTDHGSPGFICFPNDILTVKELNKALEWMHKNDRYNQLVFYLEACYSGSMFEKVLKKNINVYAITAANSHESSYATYCENWMCYGDLFSVNWMEDSEEEDITVETLDDQYKIVKQLTNLSHVMQYGDLRIAGEFVSWFQGDQILNRTKIVEKKKYRAHQKVSWPSRDVELMYLSRLAYSTDDDIEARKSREKIRKIHEDRRGIKSIFLDLIDVLLPDAFKRRRMQEDRNAIENIDCHHEVVRAFDSICVDVNKYDYALEYIYILNNLCIELGQADKIIAAMGNICSKRLLQYF